ncbi:hypothetical protein GCM10009533_52550 [Saccharopolyspora spinosporotrichia]|uniref:Uncharacterized protein n=1 Tax=Saccharopolyspora erythraea TaxID=1836 RepID=A0ABP3NNR7_SACER
MPEWHWGWRRNREVPECRRTCRVPLVRSHQVCWWRAGAGRGGTDRARRGWRNGTIDTRYGCHGRTVR